MDRSPLSDRFSVEQGNLTMAVTGTRDGTALAIIKHLALCLVLVPMVASGEARAQTSYPIKAVQAGKFMPGNVAFVDTVGKRIVELGRDGAVAWSWLIPASVIGKGDVRAAADLEWVADDDSYLLTIPFRGIFRISREGEIVWQHLTSTLSHDADLLENGNVIYVNGWDKPSDAQVTEVDANGDVVWSWHAKGKVDEGWRKAAEDEPHDSYGHTNAVVRLPDGDTLISLRNFNRVFRVSADGKIKQTWGPIDRAHEPTLQADGALIVSKHGRRRHNVMSVSPSGRERLIFDNEIGIRPIRTVETLENGNMLLTGGEEIVEIDRAGGIVWHAAIYEKSDQPAGGGGTKREGRAGKGKGGKGKSQQAQPRNLGERGVYKAVWVASQP
jgi:hypothetical protein